MKSSSGCLSLAYRLASWLLPPHRKEWADAMFNDAAYIESRWEAWQWILGCTFTAVRERVVYQLESAVMRRRIVKSVVGLVAVLVVGAAGIYAVSKPYQRDRIWITLRQAMNSGQTQDSVREQP